MPKKPLLEFTDRGIYCEKGNFYIDPWKPVDDAANPKEEADTLDTLKALLGE